MDPVIEEIRRRADIVEVIEEYVALIPAGAGRWKACCPFHNEKTPSFNVSRDKGFFKCFGCSVSGDVFKFVSLVENLPFGEVKRKLAERYGIALRDRADITPEQSQAYAERDRLLRVTSVTASWFAEQFAGNAGLQARDYARARQLKRETLQAFGIGYAPDSWDACTHFLTRKFGFSPEEGAKAGLLVEKEDERGKRYYDRYRHRLTFPIWDERGAVIGFGGRALDGGETGTPEAKYINSPEGPLFSKSRTLYAWHLARPEISRRDALIVTEGYMDAIALHAAGFGNTVATLGTSLTQDHARLLNRVKPKTVFLCFDGDGAGLKATLRAGPMFDSFGLAVRVVKLPPSHDPDTFIREFGAAGFEQVLAQAPALAQYRIEHAMGEGLAGSRMAREDAIAGAARVIAELSDEGARSVYISNLAQQVAQASGALDRLATIEESIRKRVSTAEGELKRDARNQQRRVQERAAVEVRLREKSQGEVIALPQRDANRQENADESDSSLQPEPGEASACEVLPFAPRAPGGGSARRAWIPEAEWKAQAGWKARSQEADHNQGGEAGADALAARLLANVATGDESGVVKAERALLLAMLNAPSLRASLGERVSAAMWTREMHFEIASYLKSLPEDEPVDPPRLFEELSPEAGALVGDLLLSKTMESMEPKVIDDYIKRIEAHHARHREHQNLQLILGKMQRAEPITPEELAQFAQATRETKRRVPPEA